MILYSIVPPEVVFQGNNGNNEIKYYEAGYKGERVLVARLDDGQYSITRLLSSNPRSFLDPSFQPGNIVDARELVF